jgi:predicted membrane-bound spermidine synthase
MASDLYRVPGWVFKVCGLTGALFAMPMVFAYLLAPALGLGRPAAIEGFVAILAISVAIYIYATYRFDRVAKNFTVIPYESEELYK